MARAGASFAGKVLLERSGGAPHPRTGGKPVKPRPAEKIIAGKDVRSPARWSGASAFCESALFVKKKDGAEVCGDSVFSYSDRKKAVLGVFDGVGGKAGAELASSEAAAGALSYLKETRLSGSPCMLQAFESAAASIGPGSTTGVIALICQDGSGILGSVGDSPAYVLRADGTVEIQLPLDNMVGDGSPLLDFFNNRHIIFSSLPEAWMHAHIAPIKLSKGDCIILASDGLSENLYVAMRGEFVTDCSGVTDLSRLLGSERSPARMITVLAKEVARRIEAVKIRKKGKVMMSKQDDLAIAALRFK
jgi:serine/threonine protein phosphatase PrpC